MPKGFPGGYKKFGDPKSGTKPSFLEKMKAKAKKKKAKPKKKKTAAKKKK